MSFDGLNNVNTYQTISELNPNKSNQVQIPTVRLTQVNQISNRVIQIRVRFKSNTNYKLNLYAIIYKFKRHRIWYYFY